MVTFWPSIKPSSRSPWWNAVTRCAVSSADLVLMNPTMGVGRWAFIVAGHNQTANKGDELAPSHRSPPRDEDKPPTYQRRHGNGEGCCSAVSACDGGGVTYGLRLWPARLNRWVSFSFINGRLDLRGRAGKKCAKCCRVQVDDAGLAAW